MRKVKALIGLGILICTMIASAAPANAWFQSNAGQEVKGPIQAFPGVTTFEYQQGATKFADATCESTASTKAAGFWIIQNSEEAVVTKTTKEQKQPATKLGPHESLTIEKWGNCVLHLNSLTFPLKASPCRLSVQQPEKGTFQVNQTASIQTDCSFEWSGLNCLITIEQEPANHGLKEIRLENRGTNEIEIKANIKQLITAKANAGCATAGLPGKTTESNFFTGTEAELKPFFTGGQKLV